MERDPLNRVSKEALRDLLCKGWLTHDGMWFFAAAAELGIEAANDLNRRAIRAMSEIEIRRLLGALGLSVEHLDDPEAIVAVLEDALALLLPDSVASRFRVTAGDDHVRWEWDDGECFAFKGMRRAGLLDGYECGVIYRIQCWFEHLGIPSDTDPAVGKCLMARDGHCSGRFLIAPDPSR